MIFEISGFCPEFRFRDVISSFYLSHHLVHIMRYLHTNFGEDSMIFEISGFCPEFRFCDVIPGFQISHDLAHIMRCPHTNFGEDPMIFEIFGFCPEFRGFGRNSGPEFRFRDVISGFQLCHDLSHTMRYLHTSFGEDPMIFQIFVFCPKFRFFPRNSGSVTSFPGTYQFW